MKHKYVVRGDNFSRKSMAKEERKKAMRCMDLAEEQLGGLFQDTYAAVREAIGSSYQNLGGTLDLESVVYTAVNNLINPPKEKENDYDPKEMLNAFIQAINSRKQHIAINRDAIGTYKKFAVDCEKAGDRNRSLKNVKRMRKLELDNQKYEGLIMDYNMAVTELKAEVQLGKGKYLVTEERKKQFVEWLEMDRKLSSYTEQDEAFTNKMGMQVDDALQEHEVMQSYYDLSLEDEETVKRLDQILAEERIASQDRARNQTVLEEYKQRAKEEREKGYEKE